MRISDWSSDVCSSDLGGDFQEIGLELVAGTDVHGQNPVIEPGFLQEHRDLVPVGRGPLMQIDHAAGSGSVDGIAGTWGTRSPMISIAAAINPPATMNAAPSKLLRVPQARDCGARTGPALAAT